MRTQIAKTGYLPAEYIPHTFLTRTPSPFCAGSLWGLLSRKIFSNFIFLILARYLVNGFLRLNNFFYFFWIHYQLVLIIHRFWFYFFVSPIRFLLVFYFFIFSDFRLASSILGFQLNSFIFTRYYLDYDSNFASDSRLVFTRIKLCRFYALTLQLFISLTLLLVINKHLCLYEFGLCLFWLF